MTEANARLRDGALTEALALLDEAMLPVQTGQVPPDFAGNIYCQMIEICWELGDLRRAREWTAATEQWCSTFDSALMFSGICRMHRVQLRQVAGEWDVAAEEARVVCTELVDMNVSVVAEGHYLLGDLLRLRDDVAGAEAAYLRAHELGRDPQPGLGLLTARSGQPGEALASMRTSLAGYRGGAYGRAPLLRALVEVAIDAGDMHTAADGADELSRLAERWKSEGLAAGAVHARGAMQLASLELGSAVGSLREAVARWRELGAPYDCARARVTLAEALTAIGDHKAAHLELDTAELTLTSLGATADLSRLPRAGAEATGLDGLTPRETEIIALVAEGSTNRQVAAELVISEKTVSRHLANVYLKLGVPNRTAAVAWARRQGLPPPT
jgi:DNA-binding CsgD family transcriptional regulator